jgi:hypothetical protein
VEVFAENAKKASSRYQGPSQIVRAVNIASSEGQWPSKYSAFVFHFNTGEQPHFSRIEPPRGDGVFHKLLKMSGTCASLLSLQPGFISHSAYFAGHYIAKGLRSSIVAHNLPFISKRTQDLIGDLPQGIVVAIASLRVVMSLWNDVRALGHAPPEIKCEAALHLLISLAGCASLIWLWSWAGAGPTVLMAAVSNCVAALGQYGPLFVAFKNIVSLLADKNTSARDKFKTLTTKIAIDCIITVLGIDKNAFTAAILVITRNQGLVIPILKQIEAVVKIPLVNMIMPSIVKLKEVHFKRAGRFLSSSSQHEEELSQSPFIRGISSTWNLLAAGQQQHTEEESPQEPNWDSMTREQMDEMLLLQETPQTTSSDGIQAKHTQEVALAQDALFFTIDFLLLLAEMQRDCVRNYTAAAAPRILQEDPDEPEAPPVPRYAERRRQRSPSQERSPQSPPAKRRRNRSPSSQKANRS